MILKPPVLIDCGRAITVVIPDVPDNNIMWSSCYYAVNIPTVLGGWRFSTSPMTDPDLLPATYYLILDTFLNYHLYSNVEEEDD